MSKVVINTETGEYMREPAFVKLYFEALSCCEKLTGLEQSVFLFLISKMDEKNTVSIGKNQRKDFADKNGTSVQCITNGIQALKNKGLITVLSKGEYVVSPRIASRTNWDNVVKIILKQEFSTQGITRSVEFVEGHK